MKTLRTSVAGILFSFFCSFAIAAPPPPPQNIQQAWLGPESLLLWDDVPGATSYNIYRADQTNTTWTAVGSSSVPRFRDPTWQFLPSFYVVTAVNADGESAASDLSTVSYVESGTIYVYEPRTWEGTLSPTNAIIQWSTADPYGAQGLIDWGLDSTNFTFFALNTNYLAYQTFELTNLTPLTTYHYRLTSINSNRSGVLFFGSFGTPDTNHPPVAEDNFLIWVIPTNGVGVTLRGYDSNNPPQSLTFRIVAAPTNGTASAPNPGWEWNTAYTVYTPAPGARGYDQFKFVVNNGTWDSAPATVTVTNWFNTPPLGTNGSLTIAEDTPVEFSLPVFDAEGDPITFEIFPWSAWNGTVSGTAPNLIFTPASNFNGVAWFWYRVSDGYEQVNASFEFNVTPVNDKPEIRTNFMMPLSTYEEQPKTIGLMVFDEEWGQPFELIQVIPPTHGTLTGDLWNLVYTPETNFFGTDYFTVAVREADGTTSDPVTFPVQVLPWNDAPEVQDQDVTTLEDVPVVITPAATDIDSPPVFTFRIPWMAGPTNGWVEETGTNFIYHPYPDFNGSDEFQFQAQDDGFWWSAWGRIRIQVTAVGEAPVAAFSWAMAHQDAFVNSFFRVSDVDSSTLACEVVAPPTSGMVIVNGTNFFYQPNPGFQGSDEFTFRAFDGEFYGGVTNVSIWVTGPNTVPSATPQTISVVQNTPITESLLMSDPDGDWLTAILVDAPQHGTVIFDGNLVTYSPTNDFLGADSFTYQAFDGVTNSATTLVTINVALPNVAPVAYSTNLMTQRDVPLSFTLLATDGDGDALTYILTASPANGVLSGTAPNLVYTPASGFMGTDNFTFKANDGTVDGNTATVTITTTRPNVAPTAASQSVTTAEDNSIAITLTGSDGDGDPLTYTILSGPSHGLLSGSGANRTYTPAANYNGSDSFTFTVNDGLVDGNTATVSLTITPVNDAPVLLNPTTIRTLPEEWVTSWNPSATDPDGDPLTFRLVTPPSHGTLDTTNWLYRAPKDYNGGDYFSWVVNDGTVDSALGTFSISITPVNDAPVASNQTVTVDTEVSTVITPLVSDVDNSSLTLTVITQPQHGVVTVNGMTFSYQPAAGYSGSDSFTYRASDGSLNSGTATISINVVPINNAPVRISPDRAFTISEDWYREFDAQASDADGDALTYRIVTQPTNGTLTQLTSNTWRYRPNWNWFGSDSVTWVANDGQIDSTIGTVWFYVTSQNDRPMSGYDSLTNAEDTEFAVTLWSGDADGDLLTYIIVTAPTNGVLSGSGSNITYTPNPNFVGGDSLVFKVNDGQMDSFPGTIWFTVTNVNDAPVANSQSVTLNEGASTNITLTASDVDNGSLSYAVLVAPANGILSGSAPDLTYTPNADFNGGDSFEFIVSDGSLSSTNVVSITVLPVNDAPVANAQTVSTDEDGNVAIVLIASDADGDVLAFSVLMSPTNGTLSGTAPNLTYTPNANYNGADSFTFSASDAQASSVATVTISVAPVNDAPVANTPSPINVAEDSSAAITLTGSDVDGDMLTFVIVTPPAHGTLSGTAPNLTYAPNVNFHGSDAFTFKVNDGVTDGNIATASITVAPVNDAPVANAQTVSTDEDSSVAIALTASDVDGDALTFSVSTPPTNGTLSGTAPNLTYTPAANFNGTDSFTFSASDGTTSAVAAVIITVTPVNDTPVANSQSLTVAEDSTLLVALTGSDVDGDMLSFTIMAAPANGTLSGTAPNLTYIPNANYNGADNFTFVVTDGTTNSSAATVSITVTPVNDAPVANALSMGTDEDAAVGITLTGSDVEGDALSFSIVTPPANGTLSGTAPNLTYTPNANFYGSDAFTFRANDGQTNGSTAAVSITISAVNDAPVANAQSVSVAEDASLAVTLTGSDVENSPLTFTVIASPTHGTLSGTAPNLTYAPVANYNGADSFTFRVNDGSLNSSAATVSINVTAVNDAPIANAQSVTVIYNTAKAITLTGSDLEGAALTYSIVTTPTNGTLSGTAPNVTYTPTIGSAGADRFTFLVNDGSSNSAAAMVSITTLNPTGIPNAPSSLTVTVPTPIRTLILNWSCTATNEDGFKIERSLNGNNGWNQIATTGINVHTFTDTGLTSNTRYYYRVRSYNRLGNSAYSNTANGRAK